MFKTLTGTEVQPHASIFSWKVLWRTIVVNTAMHVFGQIQFECITVMVQRKSSNRENSRALSIRQGVWGSYAES